GGLAGLPSGGFDRRAALEGGADDVREVLEAQMAGDAHGDGVGDRSFQLADVEGPAVKGQGAQGGGLDLADGVGAEVGDQEGDLLGAAAQGGDGDGLGAEAGDEIGAEAVGPQRRADVGGGGDDA